ncbi:hypothetical protein pipiens_004166 [Culex pipiens pipiens]|uniref:Uncharacterized protein n=1 Tax=Culex pipiens pipiens TaxID=38569 RepID=A0ABD1CM99_CULPP
MPTEQHSNDLLEHFKKIDVVDTGKETFSVRFQKFWKKFKLKSALSHVGLLVSLAVYCGVGGVVSGTFPLIILEHRAALKDFHC